MTVLDQLKKWKVAPPEPPQYDNGGGGGNNKAWEDKIFNELRNQLWMIRTKHWKDNIHIGNDLVKRYPRIPESYIRSITNALMADPDNYSFTQYFIKGS